MSHPLDRCGRCLHYHVEHDGHERVCPDNQGTYESMEIPVHSRPNDFEHLLDRHERPR